MNSEYCTVSKDLILDLISSSVDYGFDDDVLMSAFAEMLGHSLSDEAIKIYAKSVEATEGYTEEDYVCIRDRLMRFKRSHLNHVESC